MICRVLITGAAGMLGAKVSSVLAADKRLAVYNSVRRTVGYLQGAQVLADLTEEREVKTVISELKPNVLVHCAANVNLDDCEQNKEAAYMLHVETVRRLVEFGGQRMRVIYLSTDSVYDGKRGVYSESDEPNPLNYYAETKLLGERVLMEHSPASLVLRLNIYGFHLHNGKSLAEWAIRSLSGRKPVNGFDDVIFNPLYVGQVASIIQSILFRSEVAGVLHLGCREAVSKFEFLRSIASVFGFDSGLVRRSSFKSAPFAVPRPLNTSLDTRRFNGLFGNVPKLRDGVKELREDYTRRFLQEHAL